VCQHADVPLATYRDLCIDAVDAEGAARFWGGLLDLSPGPHRDGIWFLDDAAGRAVAWVNPVPEPKTVKNRVHIDVNAESLEAALAAGATVVDDTQRWTVMTDPDGQEFCVFVRDTPIERRLYELVWDSGPDADGCLAIARWWAEVLGADASQDESGDCYLENVPGAPFEFIVFGSPSRRRSRTGCTSTSPPTTSTPWSPTAPGWCVRRAMAVSAGPSWPTRTATSSARCHPADAGHGSSADLICWEA
jgi:hypothetical protein